MSKIIKTNSEEKSDNTIINSKNILPKELQEEIKNIVINKMLNQIEKLVIQLEEYKKENLLLKNDLIYILKRVLLTKNEYVTLLSNAYSASNLFGTTMGNNLNNSLLLNKSNKSILSLDSNINNSPYIGFNTNLNCSAFKPCKETGLYRNITEETNLRNSYDNNAYHLDSTKQNSVDNKVNRYLNSLYRHNFPRNIGGIQGKYSLNKNKSLYEELFPHKNISNKLCYINTDITNFNGKNGTQIKPKSQKRIPVNLNRADFKELQEKSDSSKKFRVNIQKEGSNITKPGEEKNKFINKKNSNEDFLKVKKRKLIGNNTASNFRRKKSKSKSNSIKKVNSPHDNRNNTKNIYSNNNNRSPFLVNKF